MTSKQKADRKVSKKQLVKKHTPKKKVNKASNQTIFPTTKLAEKSADKMAEIVGSWKLFSIT